MVHGGNDTVVPAESVSKLVQKLSQQRGIQIDLDVIPEADHFFGGHLEQLVASVEHYVDKARQAAPQPAVVGAR
jgi:alpha/beta superfamily hydrolase